MTKLAKGFGGLARGALDTFRNAARAVEPLAAITGAASIAGMIRLTQAWASWGAQLGFAARRLGIMPDALQALQGAARLAGASASSLNSGLQTLGQHLYDAAGGRDPAMVQTMRYLGFSMADVNKAGRNTASLLPQIADRIKGIQNPFAQAAVATALFGGAAEELLPFLRLGSAGIAEYNAMARKYGVTNKAGTDAANRLRMAQTGLSLAVEGLGNSVAQKLAPVLTPLLDQMSSWIARNREWISTKIGFYVRQFAAWLQSVNWQKVGAGITQVTIAIGGAVNALGGWGPAARDVMLFIGGTWLAGMLAPLVTIAAALVGISSSFLALPALAAAAVAATGYSVVKLSKMATAAFGGDANAAAWGLSGEWNPYDTSSNAPASNDAPGATGVRNTGMAYFMANGWSKAQAAGIMANAQAESGYKPDATNTQDGIHRGLWQWSAARRAAIMKGTGVDVWHASAAQQFAAMQWELTKGTYAKVGAGLHSQNSAIGAAVYFDNRDEASGDNFLQQARRGITALNLAGLDYAPAGPAANIGDGSPAPLSGAGGAAQVNVEINHKNAPPGTSTKAVSSDPRVKVTKLKVGYAMVGHA